MKFSGCFSLHCLISPMLLLTLLAVTPSAVFSQTSSSTQEQSKQSLPTASQVLDHFAAALGGKEAIRKHDSITTRGKLELPAQGLRLEYLELMKPGKKLVKISKIDGNVVVVAQDGIYGDVHWHWDSKGATIVPAENPGSLHRDTDPFYWGLTQMNYFQSMQTLGIEDFDGRSCYHLSGITKWGEENSYFFDKESGLLLGYQWQQKRANGERTLARVVLSGYKDFGGRKFPARSSTQVGGTEVNVLITEGVDYSPLAESSFSIPDEVKKIAPASQGQPAKPNLCKHHTEEPIDGFCVSANLMV